MTAAEWAGVDAALGRPRALERVVERLPPRLGWLARALEALDDGRRDVITTVARGAESAGERDIAAVLDLVLTDPATIHPTAVRKAAQKARLGEGTHVAFLDLLRSLAVYRTGTTAPPAAGLRAACTNAACLQAVIDTLTSTSGKVYQYTGLAVRMPRAAQVMTAAQALRRGAPVGPDWIRSRFTRPLLDLDPTRWPDLGVAGERATIERRLAGTEPWTEAHDDASEWLYNRPPAEGRTWLGALLRRIAEQVRAGHTRGLLGAVHAASHLAHAHPDLADLTVQLSSLEARLSWIEGEHTALLGPLWAQRSRLGPTEVAALARLLLTGEQSEDDEVMEQAAAVLLSQPSTPMGELLDLVDRCVALDRRGLEAALAPSAPTLARKTLILALHAAARRDTSAALHGVPPLVAAGDIDGASEVFVLALERGKGLDPRALGSAAAALATTSGGPAVHALARAIGSMRDLAPLAAAARRWAPTVDARPGPRGELVALAAASGASEVATALVLEEGRRLRTLPDGDMRAFEFIAAALTAARPRIADPLHGVLAPLDKYVLRSGDAAALKVVTLFPETFPYTEGLVSWFLHHQNELGRQKGWRSWLLSRTVPIPPFGGPMQAMFEATMDGVIVEILSRRPRSSVELAEAITRMFASMRGMLDGLDDHGEDVPF